MAESKVPVSTGMSVALSQDGSHVVLTFALPAGEPVNVAIPARNLGEAVGHMLSVSGALAEQFETPYERNAPLNAEPIPVASLGVARGRSDVEALLAIRTGPMTLAFSLDLATLLGMCADLQKATMQVPPTTSH